MRLLDKIALNRLAIIVLNFILTTIKYFYPKNEDNTPPIIKPVLKKRRTIIPRGKK